MAKIRVSVILILLSLFFIYLFFTSFFKSTVSRVNVDIRLWEIQKLSYQEKLNSESQKHVGLNERLQALVIL